MFCADLNPDLCSKKFELNQENNSFIMQKIFNGEARSGDWHYAFLSDDFIIDFKNLESSMTVKWSLTNGIDETFHF